MSLFLGVISEIKNIFTSQKVMLNILECRVTEILNLTKIF